MELLTEKVSSEGNIPEIARFQAVVINRYQVLLEWAVSENVGSSYDINDYEFFLHRSFSDVDEFEEFTESLNGITEYLDEPQSLISTWRRIFYKLRIRHKASGEEDLVGPVSIHEVNVPTQHVMAMIHRHNMFLERFPVGSLCYAWTQRQWGSRCSCWNPVTSMSDDTQCVRCAGTGWYFPYLSIPVQTYICLNPDVELLQIMDWEVEQDEKHCWCSNYPDFKRRDVILVPGKNNSLYRVHNKKWLAQERNEIGVVQALHLVAIDQSEPEVESLGIDVSNIKEYMSIAWNHSRKTYFGCRTGLPDKDIKRDHGKKYYERIT